MKALARTFSTLRPSIASVTQRGWARYGTTHAELCRRPLFTRLIPRVEAAVPADVARGGVQHSYPAYRDGLHSMSQDNPLPGLLRVPTHQ